MANDINVKIQDPISVDLKSFSSTEIKRNSKGVTEFVVKVYDEDPQKATEKAQKLFKALEKKFEYDG